MYHSKFVYNFKILSLLLGSILFTACGGSGKNVDPNIGTSKVVANNDLCKVEGYNMVAMDSNLKKIKNETYFHQSTLSGAAKDLKDLIQDPKLSDSYAGLSFTCEGQKQSLQIGCEGQIKIVDAGKTESLNYQQLLDMSPIYVKNVTICGPVKLNPDDALFIVADHTLFQNVSIDLNESAVFSLSSQLVDGALSNLKSVTQRAGSSISIHAVSIHK